MANEVYNAFKQGLLQGSWNGTANTPPIWCLLVGAGYTADVDAHDFRSDLDNEITGSNYNAGGFALSSPVVSTDAATNQARLDAGDVFIANITFNTDAAGAVLYGSTAAGASGDPLICFVDFGGAQAVTAGTFQITWAAGGILAIT